MLGHRGAPSPYPLLLPRWSWLATLGEEEEEEVVARGGEEKGGESGRWQSNSQSHCRQQKTAAVTGKGAPW